MGLLGLHVVFAHESCDLVAVKQHDTLRSAFDVVPHRTAYGIAVMNTPAGSGTVKSPDRGFDFGETDRRPDPYRLAWT